MTEEVGTTAQVAASEVVEQAPQQPVEEAKFSSRFAALTRREREISRKAHEASEREKALVERERKYEAWEKLRASASEDPLAYLKESGLTYQQITEKILEDETLSHEAKAERIAQAKIDEYDKKQREREEKLAEERQAAKDAELIDRYKKTIDQVVSADLTAFELINHEGAEAKALVFSVAEEHYERTGEIIAPEVAAQHVENYLEKRYKEVLNTKKLSKLREQAPEETQQGDDREVVDEQTFSPKTLTNRSLLASGAPVASTQSRMLSDDESKAAAARFLEKAMAANRHP